MTISVGDALPHDILQYIPYDPKRDPLICSRPVPFDLAKELQGKKVIIFAVPGAFTPTCSETHVPEFLAKYDELKSKGVDLIICTATNDGFVMDAWGRHLDVKDKIIMASGNDFFEHLGLILDLTKNGMGVRSKRFALIVDDLKVIYVGVDESGVDKSGPNAILASL